MKNHIAIAVGALLTLGTAVATTLNDETRATKAEVAIESSVAHMGTKQSEQILAMWKTHSTSSGSVPLSRPL